MRLSAEKRMTKNEFLLKQKDFLVRKQEDFELEWQDLADMRTDYSGTVEHRDTVRKGAKLINEYISEGWDIVPPSGDKNDESETNFEQRHSFEIKGDGTGVSDRLISICEGETITPEFLLEAHNLPPEKWKVVAYRNNYWHSQVKGGKRMVMYQSRVTVKPYAEDEISPYSLEQWFSKFEPKPIKYEKLTENYGSGDNCLVLPVVDLHYNLYATRFITGNDYNCEIAKYRLLHIIDDVISRVSGRAISKIIFPIGNDLFNANGIAGTTFKGTPQDNEKHIFEAYVELFGIMVECIAKLAQIAPVDVVYIPSNHDKEVTFYFMHNLHTQFKADEDVEVDFSPITNKYRTHGNTLMMFSHNAKINKLGNVVFDEAGDFSNSSKKYIEVFLAHLHTEAVSQDRNVTIRRLPTISGKSAWTAENNYGLNQVSQSFIINDTLNITDIMYTRIL